MSLAYKDAVKVSSGINMTVTVTESPSVKMVKKGTLKVTELKVQDKNGDTIKVSLFGAQADGIENGTTIKLVGATTSEFRGEISLNIPRWGKVEVVN